MQVTRTSMYSGKERTRDLAVTQEQMDNYLLGMSIPKASPHLSGTSMQQAFPNLSADDREFIMTGITPEEWEELDLDEVIQPTEAPEDEEDRMSGYAGLEFDMQ